MNTANILFPTSLAADMHKTGNIDNCGEIKTEIVTDVAKTSSITSQYTEFKD